MLSRVQRVPSLSIFRSQKISSGQSFENQPSWKQFNKNPFCHELQQRSVVRWPVQRRWRPTNVSSIGNAKKLSKCRTNPMVSGGTCFEVHHSGFMSESDANCNVSRCWRSGSRLDEVQFPKVNGMQCRRHSAKGRVTVPRGSAVLPKIPVPLFQLKNGWDVVASQPGGVRATVMAMPKALGE